MKSPLITWFLCLWYASFSAANAQMVIDHECDDLSAIPAEWITAAKNDLYIGYGRTSHGTQLTSGMDAIENYYTDGSFNWSHDGGTNELHLFEGDGYGTGYLDHDLGSTNWDEETREYLNAYPACNVIIWSWCSQVNDVDLTTHYFEPMELLEAEYPSVTFVYMTGRVEGLGPNGSVFLANQQIRDYCLLNNKVLFDFADIEKYDPDATTNYQEYYCDDDCDYDPDGVEPINRTENWANNWLSANPSHDLSQISGLCASCAHSVSLNCVKKGVAAWYLWARIAGWDGNNDPVPVTDITISSEGNATSIDTPGGTLQLSAQVLPENATNKTISWTVQNGNGEATVSSDGLVTAVADGDVTVTAAATDGSGISDDFIINISNQPVPVEDIVVTSEGSVTSIDTPGGTLQLYAEVLPANATNPDVLWSVQSVTGQATVSTSGLVTAVADGTVNVTASSTDGTGVSGSLSLSITGQTIYVTDITITSEGDATSITEPGGTLQLYAEVLPVNASDPDVLWSVQNGTGEADVSTDGLVTALADGTVTITASATDGSGISGTFGITISGQTIYVSDINITSEGDATSISVPNGTLQLYAEVLPANATNPAVLWSVQNGTGQASVSSGGLVTAESDGLVTITASATDGSGVSETFVITITNQPIEVESITISSEGGVTTISEPEGTLQLNAEVLPANATNPSVSWSIQNITGEADISESGLVSAIANGTVIATATATDGSGISDDFTITISGQIVLVTEIIISSQNDISLIEGVGNTLQLSAEVLPVDATDPGVVWSVQNGTGQASISSSGLVTAEAEGTVTAIATAIDGSEIFDEFNISIVAEVIEVETITITSQNNSTSISTQGGSLQLYASVLPSNASNKEILWSIGNGTGSAAISQTGLVTAINNGTVIATASATDGSGVSEDFTITISNQIVLVNSININSPGGINYINTPGGNLQLSADVLPVNASNPGVIWSLQNGTGSASINSNGLVTALTNGSVIVTATAADGSGISDNFEVTISNQFIPVSSINIQSAGGVNSINTPGGTLQLSAVVYPQDATNSQVLWSIQNQTGEALISPAGLVTAVSNGSVTATASAVDGSGVSGVFTISISNQLVQVEEINISSAGGVNTINTAGGTLQLSAEVLPANASNPAVLWSVQNGTGQAVVSTSGLVTAVSDGNVTVTASATDGSGVSDVFTLTISNQLVMIKSITISSVNGSASISENGGSLQLVADINPANASNPQVLWSIANESGWAEIDDSGLVLALTNGTVRAIASAADGSGVADDFVITISNQVFIEVEDILVSSEDDMETITVDDGSLQLYAEIFPEDATDQRVLWEVCNVSGEATISETGLVRAVSDGIIYASASSVGNSHIQDYIVITISGQIPNEISVLQSEINYQIIGNTLRIDNTSGYLSHIRIIDLNGRVLRNENLQAVERSIELWPFQKGIYILQFISGSSAIDNLLISLH